MQALLDRNILLVTGKGGVGKSTVAQVLARWAARRGQRVLLVEFEALSRAAAVYGKAEAPPDPELVDKNLWLVHLDAEHVLHSFAREQLKFEAAARMVMRNKTVRGFFLAMPAIKSVLFLYHLWRLETRHGPDGDGSYQLIVCDLPTSGFVIGMHAVPAMLRQVFSVGPLAAYARGIEEMVFDRRRTGVVLVTLAEEMPTVETLELGMALKDRFGIEPTAVIANSIYPEAMPPDDLAALAEMMTSLDAAAPTAAVGTEADAGVAGLMWAAHLLNDRHQRARALLPSLHEAFRDRLIELPHLFRRQLGQAGLDILVDAVEASTGLSPAEHAQ